MQDVVARISAYHPELTAIRRDIHAHPEMGLEEHRTAALVAATLRGWGVAVTEGLGGTGVVGTVRGDRPGQRAIGLRADMDALAIHEETGLPWASRTPGTMHACGHDGHTAMLLGAARYLAEARDFGGIVHLIFQPAEEGRGGARAMLADGLFERFPVDAVYGLHNAPGMPVGRFGTRFGPMMAAADSWRVVFRGTGGHGGSTPHMATDATVVLGHFLLALQTIVPRNVPAADMAVVSVGHVGGGSALSTNVMPAEVVVAGTARSYAPHIRDLLERRLGELAHAMAASQGCAAEYAYRRGVPAVINHDEQVRVEIAAAAALAGEDAVDGDIRPSTGGEDFAEMMNLRPGAFMRIGNGAAADGTFHGLHTPMFDFNDDILPLGAAYWVSVVRQELGGAG